MNLQPGQRLTLPNGVQVRCEAAGVPGQRWLLRHPWACWAITDAGAIVNVVMIRGKMQTTPTGWTVSDLREGSKVLDLAG